MSRRVLVVENDTAVRNVVAATVESIGYRAGFAAHASGFDAYTEAFPGDPYAIVMINVGMDQEGAELAQKIKDASSEKKSNVFIIGMSGYEPNSAVASKFDAYLEKPFQRENLKSALDDAGTYLSSLSC